MKPIIYFKEGMNLDLLEKGSEIIIEHKDLSRFGKLNTEKLNATLIELEKRELYISLEWDILISETLFDKTLKTLEGIDLARIQCIRVQDPGAIEYVKKHLKQEITLILETGNHNLCGIKTWINYLEGRCNRVSLSVELDKNTLKKYIEQLSVPVEFLGLGQILIFYTPRNLLSALLPEDDDKRRQRVLSDEFLIATGESEESPHKGFPLLENKHGTFMFHIKRLFLLDVFSDLLDTGIEYLRLDTRFDENPNLELLLENFKNKDFSSFKNQYPFDFIRGYFNINKTDILFKKLKNSRLQRKDDSYVGVVLETNKPSYMAVIIKKSSVALGDELKFITPEGKELKCKIHELKNSVGVDIKEAKRDELFLMNYFGSVWPKSQVYKA